MNSASFLLQHFDRLAEAPGGIDKLRALLLQLGVQGKLTQQNPAEKSAKDIIGHFRKPKQPFAAITVDELPFQIPQAWVWARLGACMELFNGRAFKPTDWSAEGLRIVRIKNLNDETALFNHCNFPVEERRLIHDDDFLISWSGTPGTSFGAFIWKRGKAVLNQHIFRCELSSAELYKPYMRLAVNSRLDELISKAHGGVGLQHVTKPTLEHLPLPLPPLAEQRRIVAKVEELMRLCDALEAAQRERETLRTRLRTSALQRLTVPDADSKSAAFVLQYLFLFTALPDDLAEVRKSILQLAVQGNISSASRVTLDEAGDSEDEPSFAVPENWKWIRVGELGPTQTGSTPKTQEPENYGVDVPFVRPGDIYPDRIDYDGTGLSFAGLESTGRSVPAGSILMVCIGTLGKSQLTDRLCSFNQQINAVTPRDGIDPKFVFLAMNSPYFQSECLQRSSRTTIAILNKGRWERIPIPLPPLAEQRRIVAKVDELMAVLDALEAALTAGRATAGKLLAATISRLSAA